MSSLLFYLFLVGLSFVVLATDTLQNTYPSLPQVPEGITVHNVIETWSEAHIRCQNEGGVLASPINEKTLNVMKSLMSNTNAMYYIGIKAFHSPGQFVSVEGVPLERMNVSLWQQLDPWAGDCLAMTFNSIHVVPCDTRLPYMCYNKHIFNMDKTNCGPGYKYDVPAKSCYKIHTEYLPWVTAQMACVAEGANLAVIDNEVEAESIKNIYGATSYIWIGLLDFTGNGDWISVHWQRVEELYNVWVDGQKRIDPPCGYFKLPSYLSSTNCSYKIDFICEKEPTY